MDWLFGSESVKEIVAPELHMPHEAKNFIIHRCFDACIYDYKDKTLLITEKTCMEECTNNLKVLPRGY